MTNGQPDEEQPRPPHRVAGTRRRVPPLLVAAAFVVAGGVGLFLVLSGGSTHDGATHGTTTAVTTGAMSPGQSSSSNSPGPHEEATPRGNARAVRTLTVAKLGTFLDEAGLVHALGAVDPRTLSPAVSTSPTRTDGSATVASSVVDRCEPTARGLLPRQVSDRMAVGIGSVGKRQLLVFSFRTSVTSASPEGALLVAVDRTNCYPVTVHIR